MASSKLFLLLTIIAACLAAVVFTQHAKTAQSKIGATGNNSANNEFWGYVDVRPGAHMFYWLYHTYHTDGYLNRPLIIWLQGGPGASSCGYGNFELIGPLFVNQSSRNTTWVNEASVLFIDNPVGAGYSYVEDDEAYTTKVTEITLDLTTFLKTFLTQFPEFTTIPLFIFGQSYGGKMAAHFAVHLYNERKQGNIFVNLTGFAMGNAWISPVDSTTTWGPLLYQMALVDQEGHDRIQAKAEECKDAVDNKEWLRATQLWNETEWVVNGETHGVNFYNILKFGDVWGQAVRDLFIETEPYSRKRRALKTKDSFRYQALPDSDEDPLDTLMNGPIKQKLGIIPSSVTWGGQYSTVFRKQNYDFMKDVVSTVDAALQDTDLEVVVYQGQLDLICDVVGAMQWVQKLQWKDLGNYNAATRKRFYNNESDDVEMYVKSFKKFKFYWVLGGGHSIAKDNPGTAYYMMQRILGNMDASTQISDSGSSCLNSLPLIVLLTIYYITRTFI